MCVWGEVEGGGMKRKKGRNKERQKETKTERQRQKELYNWLLTPSQPRRSIYRKKQLILIIETKERRTKQTTGEKKIHNKDTKDPASQAKKTTQNTQEVKYERFLKKQKQNKKQLLRAGRQRG